MHAPIPWKVDGEDIHAVVVDANDVVVARTDQVFWSDPRFWEKDHLDTMRLIAAAPKLLRACQRMLAHIDNVGDDSDLMACRKDIVAAIQAAVT